MTDTFDFHAENIDDILGSDFDSPEPISDTSTEVTQPDVQESVDAPPSQADAAPANEQPKDWNPEGPGNVREALRQAREEARAAREQAEQVQAYLAQLQAQAQPQEAAPEIDPLDPDAHAFYTQQLEAIQSQTAQQMSQMRLEMAETFARQSLPDYDAVVGRLKDYAGVLNVNAILQSPNPALAAYQFAKQLGPNPQDIEAQVNAQVEARLKALAPQLTAQQPQAPKTLSNIPAAATNADGPDLSNLTKADFKKYGLDLLDHLG